MFVNFDIFSYSLKAHLILNNYLMCTNRNGSSDGEVVKRCQFQVKLSSPTQLPQQTLLLLRLLRWQRVLELLCNLYDAFGTVAVTNHMVVSETPLTHLDGASCSVTAGKRFLRECARAWAVDQVGGTLVAMTNVLGTGGWVRGLWLRCVSSGSNEGDAFFIVTGGAGEEA